MADPQDPWNAGGPPPPPPRLPNVTPFGGGNWGGPPPGRQPPDLGPAWDAFRRFVAAGGPRLLGFASLALAGIWLATGFYRVQPDEEGLVLRFGAYVRSTPPGLNYHAPWPIETARLLPVTRINRVEIGFRSEGDAFEPTPRRPDDRGSGFGAAPERDLREESLMLTGDENIVDINASVFWRISNAADYAFATRNPGYTVKSAAESVLRQVIGHTDIQAALTGGRAAIEGAVMTGAQKILDGYRAGVTITQVQLQKVDPPSDVIESFRDVQRANTDADRARNEAQAYANDIVPRARGEAAGITAAAEGDKLAAIAAARGQGQRFLSVYQAYAQAKDITVKRLYLETMQDILTKSDTTVVDDRLGRVLPVLPLRDGGK